MKLREILKGQNNVRIKEYERYGNELIFVGGCYYADKRLIPLDGNFYVMDLEVSAYNWKNSNTLTIVR